MTLFSPLILAPTAAPADAGGTETVSHKERRARAAAYVSLKASGTLIADSPLARWIDAALDADTRGNLDTLVEMRRALAARDTARLRPLAKRLHLKDAANRRLANLLSMLPAEKGPTP